MASRTPPRFVPTLTEVVRAGGPAALAPAAASSAPAPSTPASSFLAPSEAGASVAVSPLLQEQIAQRVMQRVDVALERRLREAIEAVVLEQASALAPLLRERIEAAVRDTVAQAVAEEIDACQRAGGADV